MTEEEQDQLIKGLTVAIGAHHERLEQLTHEHNRLRSDLNVLRELVEKVLEAVKPDGADDLPGKGGLPN